MVTGSAAFAGFAPGWFTIAAVVVFGGAHNWVELRYFLSRLPSRLGPLRPFFITSFTGAVLLAGTEIATMVLSHHHVITGRDTSMILLIWNESLIGWVFALSTLRYRKSPDLRLAVGLALVCSLSNLLSPHMFMVAVTFLHPLCGLWIFERELRRTRKSWLNAYHRCLLAIPPCILFIIYLLQGTTSDIVSTKFLSDNTSGGFSIFPDNLAPMFMALYGFMQMVHYGIWIVAMPIATSGWRRWRLDNIPVARNKPALMRTLAVAVPLLGVLAMPALWLGYKLDYTTTNEIYITVATLHVIAEIAFMFWMCES
jgi:hypothetical protein